jgi:hypothetical protein
MAGNSAEMALKRGSYGEGGRDLVLAEFGENYIHFEDTNFPRDSLATSTE